MKKGIQVRLGWYLAVTLMAPSCPISAEAQVAPASSPVTGSSTKTWAVLCDPAVHDSGLDDLLLARLSQNREYALADRQQLNEAAKETVLNKLSDGTEVAARIKVGKILKADILVLVTQQTRSGKELLRLVVCDSKSGARLRVEYIPWEEKRPEAAVPPVLSVLEDTRKRFATGVRQTYGVPPFVSRNLAHACDQLQTGLAALLASALNRQSGVAVIEVEEARLIAREFSLTGGAAVERAVPWFVEGEYEVAQGSAAGDPTITLRIKISGPARKTRSLPERTMRLSEVSRYMSVELPAALTEPAGSATPPSLTGAEQAQILGARAEVFAQLGHWEESTQLREATLLLQDDPEQRKRLIEEYRQAVAAPLPEGMKPGKGEAYQACCGQRWQWWFVALAHLEYLVRNRQVDAWEGPKICKALFDFETLRAIRQTAEKDLAEVEQARRRFLHDIYGPMDQLPWPEKGKMVSVYGAVRKPEDWRLVYNGIAYQRLNEGPVNKEDFDFYYEMLTQVIPDDGYIRREMVFYPSEFKGPRVSCSLEDYRDFLDRLEKSDRWVNKMIARFYRALLEYHQIEYSTESLDPVLEQVIKLQADYSANPAKAPFPHFLARDIEDLRRIIEQNNSRRRSATSPRPTVAPPRPDRRPTPKPTPMMDGADQQIDYPVKFQKLPLQLRRLSGQTEAYANQHWYAKNVEYFRFSGLLLVNCGSFDVVWEEGGLLFHRQKGLLEEAVIDPQAQFSDVKWDGERVWAGMKRGEILVLSKEGKELARVTEKHGLPPCDLRLWLNPLGKGKAVAVGAFGPNQRLWCGLVDLTGAAPKVTVFHQAVRVYRPAGRGHKPAVTTVEDDQPDWACIPTWVYEHQWTPEGPKVLLVGRSGFPPPIGEVRPLEIDLTAQKVTVSQWPFPDYAPGYYSHQGYLIQVFNQNPILVAPPGKTLEEGQGHRYLGAKNTELSTYNAALFWKGRLYVPRQTLCRITPGTWTTEELECAPRPDVMSAENWSVSAHFGVVMFVRNKRSWFQVIIKDGEKEPGNPAATAPATRPTTRPAGTGLPAGTTPPGR